STDVFVAKWDATAQDFTWATSGGGPDNDEGRSIAVSGTNVYVTGTFTSNTFALMAGQTLAGEGGFDIFVAKYVDTSTGSTLATSSFANGWVTSAGGTGTDVSTDIAVSGNGVYVTGTFASNTFTTIAGQALAGAGAQDVFVAKYIDTSTGSTPATSSFANGWATSAGGIGGDVGRGIAVSGTGVYVTGDFTTNTFATIAGQALAGDGGQDVFVAKYVDTSTGSTPATSSFANGWATSGGGTGAELGQRIAVSGRNVYVTGTFSSNGFVSFAGQALTGAGSLDIFVAKYIDTSTGSTPATSSFANAWATSGGGTGGDLGLGIAVSGTSVYVTGVFISSTNTRIAGQSLPGAGGDEMFLAKYVDTSTGSTPATSSFANGWATSAGGMGNDRGRGLTVSSSRVYVVGSVSPPATFGSISFGSGASGTSNFLAGLPVSTTLATTRGATQVLTLSPNPAKGSARLAGAAPYAAVTVLDALGRPVGRATADAAGSAHLTLPMGLATGVYLVRSGTQVRRLVVE
ncbi:T9SS type A sorting domain-containing protein, partial [Hymenobacter sp. BT175]